MNCFVIVPTEINPSGEANNFVHAMTVHYCAFMNVDHYFELPPKTTFYSFFFIELLTKTTFYSLLYL